jgi:hypothetical protein
MENRLKLNLLFLLLVSYFTVNAQKLPTIQQTSLRIPANLKIDGKATEWGNQFQAHNNSTNLFYTLANDDENLYLVVQAINPRVIEKILLVGVNLTINNNGQKDDKAIGNISIIYPQISKAGNAWAILRSAGDKANWQGLPNQNMFPQRLSRTDSTVIMANNTFNINSKTIKIKGVKAIDDTLISAYNDVGIKTAARFGNNGAYTYELQVPLKYLGLSVTNNKKFNYNIKLENWGNPGSSDYVINWDPATNKGIEMDADPDLNSTTDFWAEYTLTKK